MDGARNINNLCPMRERLRHQFGQGRQVSLPQIEILGSACRFDRVLGVRVGD
jgi:hypothetical protein